MSLMSAAKLAPTDIFQAKMSTHQVQTELRAGRIGLSSSREWGLISVLELNLSTTLKQTALTQKGGGIHVIRSLILHTTLH